MEQYPFDELEEPDETIIASHVKTRDPEPNVEKIYNFDFRLDGCSMRELAKALAFFFVMDDYGQMLYRKVLKESDTLLQAWEKMKRLAWGGDYAEWKEEQQQMFVKFCNDVEEFEEEKVRQQDGDSSS